MSKVNFKKVTKIPKKIEVAFYVREPAYNQIESNVSWTCPKDNKDFVDPHYRCRSCEYFVRLHEDIYGIPVIGCKFPKNPHQTILKDEGAVE